MLKKKINFKKIKKKIYKKINKIILIEELNLNLDSVNSINIRFYDKQEVVLYKSIIFFLYMTSLLVSIM
jgi:hypothetical protein